MKNGLFVILLFYALISISQEVVYKQFSSKNGLLSSYVTQVLQDDDNYIWLSTNNGISRFDGYSFENFNINNHLPENDIVSIYKLEDKTIWFLGRLGLLSYFDNNEIHDYSFNNKILELLKDYDFIEPKSLIITPNYIEFNIFEKARYNIDKQGRVSTVYSLKDSINSIDLRTSPIRYFISSQNEKTQVIRQKDTLLYTMSMGFSDEPVLCDRYDNTLFIANQNNLFVISGDSLASYSYDNAILSIQIDTKGYLWIGFKSGGVLAYENADVTERPVFHELKGKSVSSLIRDKQNSLWISSIDGGLFYLPSQIFKQVTIKDGLLDNNITHLDFSNNYLWAVTGHNAIARLDFDGIKNYKFNNKDFSKVTDIFWSNHRLWLSFKNRISFFEGEELVDFFRLDNSYENHSRINKINSGIGNDLWLSKTNGFTQIRNNKIVFESAVKNFQNLNVNAVTADPDGSLWLACKNGLWKFKNNQLFNYNQNNKLLASNIVDIVKDDKIGALWLAINGTGIVKILNDSIWLLSENEGLVSNFISSIYVQENNLWVGTKKGISKIHFARNRKETFTNITTKDGLVSNEINDIVANKEYVFIATNNGLGFFKHTDYLPNKIAPKITIKSVIVDAEIIERPDTVYLDYSSNNIKINYISLCFKSGGQVDYRFRMKGLDKDWIYTQTLSANYPFLPSGKYIFQVESANENGVWTSQPAHLYIVVSKPFWLTWWFILGLLFVLAIGAYFLYKILITVRQRKERIKREINEYRQIALTRQMNPHFIFNSLNSIQHYILQNDIRLSNKFLIKFSKLIRLILENSQSPSITLDEELGALNLYLELESLRFKDKMQYKIEVDEEIDILNISIPPMLIQPFVENAIWHGIMNKEEGEIGSLEINFILENETVICVISDNGVGRKKSAELNQKKNRTHNSMGTSITQDRVELINSIYKHKIIIEYEDPIDGTGLSQGTIVKIIFNINTK